MKVNSIKKRSDFLAVSISGTKAVAGSHILLSNKNKQDPILTNEPFIRVGYTVSKKIGGAVKRNRTKRRLRAAVAQIMPDNAELCTDYVIIARKAALDCNFSDLLRDLKYTIKKVKTIIVK